MACTSSRPKSGCIHLPVAARANTRRRFGEAANPGRALGVKDVLQWLDRVLADSRSGLTLTGVAVSGPGEPLAEPAPVLETFRAVHEKHPQLPLALYTNGLCAPEADMKALAGELAEAGVSRVTVLVDAVDTAIVERLFAWIRPGRRTLALPQAAAMLVDAQASAIRAFRQAGLLVTARMTVYPGINEAHVADVAHAVAALGADLFELAPYVPATPAAPPVAVPALSETGCTPAECASCGSAKSCGSKAAPAPEPEAPETLPALAPGRLDELRAAASRSIAMAPACDPCGEDILWMENAGASAVLAPENPGLPRPSGARVNVAVASSDGMDVDLHLGQAITFLIFGPRKDDGLPSLLGVREAPEPGGGDKRWTDLAETLGDCFAILAASAGAHPREVLAARGLTVLTAETDIKGAVDLLFGGGKKGGKKRIKAD
ncbi:MAG: radical SAM protein [Desulfovibrio sp.]|jgi:nitrogen fixation protein NifB|nr:radical SAM protein [Desulfovibrio sp.]